MARRLYTVFFYLITPLILLRLAYRAYRAPAYRQRIGERFGFFSAPDVEDCIWVHAVSVGETIAATPLIKALQKSYPDSPIVVTTMTPTGSERVRALFGDSVFHVYAPYDLPGSIKRFLRKLRPKLLVIMETELWPNTLHVCRAQNIPIVLANARLSAKSAAGYQRLSALAAPMLANISQVVAQTNVDAERFKTLGLVPSQLTVSGSIKFDIELSEVLVTDAAILKARWSKLPTGRRLIILAASTHAGEDELIIAAFQQLRAQYPDTLLIIVPRHPERFAFVAELAKREGLTTRCRSRDQHPDELCEVFIGDSMGELLLFFGCADMALVGGSWVDHGGHNSLEPAAWGLPIITGPSDYNFAAISALLQDRQALITTADSKQLADQMAVFAGSPVARTEAGANARAVVAANRGALARLLTVVESYL